MPLGTRCEIKNVNSIRFIGQAIEYEARRQIEIIEDGGAIVQETRLFDPDKGETRSMRSKEEAHDYRYFPDPDLLPLEFDDAYVEALKADLPELPDEKKQRFVSDYGLQAYDAGVLIAEKESADYFEAVAKGRDAKSAANWVINELAGRLNKEGKEIASSPVSAAQLGAILDLIAEKVISGKIAKDLFEIVWSRGRRSARHRRRARHETGHRHRCDRESGRRHHRREPRQGRGCEDQPESDRLVCRSGDEIVGRQSQSAGRERYPEGKARPLTDRRGLPKAGCEFAFDVARGADRRCDKFVPFWGSAT